MEYLSNLINGGKEAHNFFVCIFNAISDSHNGSCVFYSLPHGILSMQELQEFKIKLKAGLISRKK